MKARGGFTLIELLLAGAILATISFGALIGTMRINRLVGERSDLLAADGYCWDVAWTLFNSDYELLRGYVDLAEEKGCRACEIKGIVWSRNHPNPLRPEYMFLEHLENPVCYITLSNAVDAAGQAVSGGLCIGVNLEWGPADRRSLLVSRPGRPDDPATTVYHHPVQLFKSQFSRATK